MNTSSVGIEKVVFKRGSPLLTLLQQYSLSGGTGQSDITLDVCKHDEHRQFLASVCYHMVEWREIGVHLDIRDPVLRTYEHDYGETAEKAFRMLHHWATYITPARLATLLSALKNSRLRIHISNNEDIELACLLAVVGHLPVTDEFVLNISQSIPSAWRFIGRFLGLTHAQLEAVWYDNRHKEKVSEISLQMLLKWRRESNPALMNYKCFARALFIMHHLDSSSVCDAWLYTRRHLLILYNTALQPE